MTLQPKEDEMNDADQRPAVVGQVKRPVRPVFEHGFWWWFDPKRGGWFAGTAPQIQKPTWAA